MMEHSPLGSNNIIYNMQSVVEGIDADQPLPEADSTSGTHARSSRNLLIKLRT
jgi:hypothetical protein